MAKFTIFNFVLGVFAAWGKCCLKAGSLQLAREKFQRYFSKQPFEVSMDLEASTSLGRHLRNTSTSSGENRPKDPPLLDEIIQILETKTTPINKRVLKKLETSKTLTSSTFSLNQSIGFTMPIDPALSILNKLKNLDAIAAGNYYEEDEVDENRFPYKPRIQPLFYEECVYYLQKYGSPLSLLRFFVRHVDFRRVVNYVLETKVAIDVFSQIYIMCLEEGVIDDLHACMRETDPSLDIWKVSNFYRKNQKTVFRGTFPWMILNKSCTKFSIFSYILLELIVRNSAILMLLQFNS